MEIFRVLNRSQLSHWQDGAIWVLFAVVGGMLPLWWDVIQIFLQDKKLDFADLTGKGQLSIYAASYCATCFYVISKSMRPLKFPSLAIILLVLFVVLVVSVGTYVTVNSSENISTLRHQIFSSGVLAVILMVSVIVIVTDNTVLHPDLAKARDDDLSDLDKKFGQIKD